MDKRPGPDTARGEGFLLGLLFGAALATGWWWLWQLVMT